MNGTFASGEEFFDYHHAARFTENFVDQCFAQCAFGVGKIFRDGHSFAQGKAIRFDNKGIVLSARVFTGLGEVGELLRFGRGDAVAAHEIFGETFRCFETRGRCSRTESTDTRSLQSVDQSAGERIIGADNDKVGFLLLRESDQAIEIGRFDRNIFGKRCGPRVTGCAEQALYPRRLCDFPNEGMLAPASPDNEDGHA